MNNKISIFLVFILTVLLILGFGFYKHESDKEAKRFYRQGMSFYQQGKYSDAFYNFKQISKVSSLYDLSLLKEFQCAQKLADKNTAYPILTRLAKNLKDENILPYVLYNEALMLSENKNYSKNQLFKKFKYIYDKFPNTDFAYASAYKMAKLAEQTERNFAKNKFIEYLKYAPNGKFSIASLDSLMLIKDSLSLSDWEIVANSYMSNSRYSEAIVAYKNADFEKVWFDLSKCYKNLADVNSEKNILSKGLSLEKSSLNEKELSNAIDRWISLNKFDKVQALQKLYIEKQNSYIYPTVVYKLAESSNSLRAVNLYEFIISKYPKSIWASNSLWEVFWNNYLLGRYQVCEKLARAHMANYFESQDAPRVMYWYARVLLHEKRNLQARDMFYKVINEYPLSYYAFLSARQLKISKAKQLILKKKIAKYSIDSLNKYLFKDNLLLILALSNDFETIDELKINNEYIKSWVAYKKQNYPKAINIAKKEFNKKLKLKDELDTELEEEAKNKISFSDYELKLIYPVLYDELINEHTLKYKQSPYLLMSLIKEESHFDKNAKSAVGARGLSQLMSATADFIENKKVVQQDLYNEEESIRIGVKYFNYLVKQFDGNEYLAILSYNAGPGNVKKWLNSPNITSGEIDVFVEKVPFLETKNYIKKILSTYWIYINIYSSKNIK